MVVYDWEWGAVGVFVRDVKNRDEWKFRTKVANSK
jgi:hypothetical protein